MTEALLFLLFAFLASPLVLVSGLAFIGSVVTWGDQNE